MTWVPVLVGALLLVIALPIFADDLMQIGASNDLQERIENASWNVPASDAGGVDARAPGIGGPGCEAERAANPF